MNNQKLCKEIPFLLMVALLVLPIVCFADPGSQYCITPPFITAGVKPNLLLLIDNSASMYDLAYVDKGKKHCAANTGTACFYDSDCPAGDTCSVFDRSPYYCFDETYRSATDYFGYFDKETFYYYRPPAAPASFSEGDFAPVASAFPSGCGSVAAGSTTKTLANTMCVEYTISGTSRTLQSFVAKGNYLNWLTASKFDVEKKILTGGKFDGTGLIPESRGCVGQGYVKDANTADFINYNTGSSDPNTSLGVTFTINGEANPYNQTAPSTGGQTYINLFSKIGTAFNFAVCQKAIQDLATGSNADIKQSVDACLQNTGTADGFCKLLTSKACGTNSDCYRVSSTTPPPFVCSNNLAQSCSGATDTTSCKVADRNSCSLKPTIACTSGGSECDVPVAEKLGYCSVDKTKYAPAPGKNDTPPGNTCRTDSNCNFRSTGTDFTAASGACIGYAAASTDHFGPCVVTVAADYGPCVANYVGDCVVSAQQAAVKTKVSFQQSMQECWTIRGTTQSAPMYGFANMNTVKLQCPDIYASFKTCHNNHLQQCSVNTDCAADGSVTCDSGPTAIAAGNPALLCGTGYAGQYFSADANGNWVLTGTDSQLAEAEYRFCGDMAAPPVTDPTDAPSNTATTDNLPAILSGLGVEAQLGTPVATMRAKVATATEPTGLIQQFGNQIRLGAMSINPFGSASETALIGKPSVCSNDDGSLTKTCTQSVDCGGSNTCGETSANTTNLDGGRIIYPIGNGFCATMTGAPCTLDTDCSSGNTCLSGYCGAKGTTVCTTVANCSGASQACIGNSVGDHTTTSLIKVLDDVRANAWTPLSEVFYNAIGYFARVPSGTNAGKSRTDLRLNNLNTTSTDYTGFSTAPVDFNENYNPSEYRCQQNYVLLVTDGSSTADRNSSVNTLATLYASQAGITQTTCTGAPSGVTTDYGGRNNLPIMSWIAKNRQISDLSTASPASTTPPGNARDSITSYVVFNGESNGASGDCNSVTLLSKTAINGGTTLRQANNYLGLRNELTSVFQDVAAKAASGTAASILSNSEGSGANILQAVFYPKKVFADQTAANWIGEMQNLWYFVDPYINNSTIREDSDGDLKLNLVSDYVARFAFDNSSDRTMVQRSQDTNGDGTGDTAVGGLIDPDYVKSIWRAGKLLWSRNISTSPRTIKTSLNGTSLIDFSSSTFPGAVVDNSTALAPYLNVAVADAPTLIDWVHGQDQTGYRNRTVSIKDPVTNVTSSGVWRLGDIISSTPRVQSTVRLNTYNLPPPGGYSDKSYETYINSSDYQDRGMVYVGANDGMLHAFKLGILSVKASGNQKASLSGTNLGKEEWAYIPRNYLPYLKYLTDPAYQHLYAIDGRTLILDASIGDDGSGGNYWDQAKSANTWRTVVIGGMGLGGASRRSCTSDVACVQTPINDPAAPTTSLGYSSYFALDVTDANNPQLLWEFSNNQLGYSTTGPSIVRVGDRNKNGRWFAVFGNGPFGPIDTTTHQFKGGSDHHLRFFVVDLKTGDLVKTITTDIDNAFAGSMIGGSIDADRRAGAAVSGNYQDDAIYAGYVKYVSGAGWTDGGVARIMTKESLNPDDATTPWAYSKVVDGIGPVTTSIARLQDTRELGKNLWLYFGTGRYFYRDGTSLDDYGSRRALFGIKEPCYNTSDKPGNFLDGNCTTTVSGSLVNQTSSVATVNPGDPGWRVDLNDDTATLGAERVVTDTIALTNGTVLFTTFKPTMDKCGYGGNSFLRIVNYKNGGMPSCNALQGKVLVQLSTGEFKEVSLAEALGCPATSSTIITYPPDPLDPQGPPRIVEPPVPTTPIPIGGGKPPSDAPPVISSSTNRPAKKILHIQEH